MTNEKKFLEEVRQLSGEDLMLLTLGTNVMQYAIKQLQKMEPYGNGTVKRAIKDCRRRYGEIEIDLRVWRKNHAIEPLDLTADDAYQARLDIIAQSTKDLSSKDE